MRFDSRFEWIDTTPKKTVIETGISRMGLASLGRLLKVEKPVDIIRALQARATQNAPKGDVSRNIENNVSETVEDLERDLFWSMYAPNSDILDSDAIEEDRLANREILQGLKDSPLWGRFDTMGNSVLSSIFAKNTLLTLLQDPDIQQAMQQAGGGSGDGNDKQDGQGQGDNNESQGGQSGGNSAQNKVRQAMQKNNGALRAAALMDGKEAAENAESLMTSFSLDPGQVTYSDYQKCLQLMESMGASELNAIIEMIGRVKGISTGLIKPSILNPNGLVCNAGLTRKVTNGFCTEVAMFSPDAPEVLRDMKMLDWLDHGILGMVEGVDADRTGGLIIMVDFSGSMDGQRLTLAKALALGFAKSAQSNGQKYNIQGFSESDDRRSAKASRILSETDDWMSHLDWASLDARGGTDFDYAMESALDMLDKRDNREEYDIIFITDGSSRLSNSTIERFKSEQEKYGTRLLMLRIASDAVSEMNSIVTGLVDIDDKTKLEDAAQLLGEALKESRGI